MTNQKSHLKQLATGQMLTHNQMISYYKSGSSYASSYRSIRPPLRNSWRGSVSKHVPNNSSRLFWWFTQSYIKLLLIRIISWYLGVSRDLLDSLVGSIFDDGCNESLVRCHCDRNMDWIQRTGAIVWPGYVYFWHFLVSVKTKKCHIDRSHLKRKKGYKNKMIKSDCELNLL